MSNKTIFWYDLETFGTNPHSDRIAQAAAIRTDLDLNPISEPILIYQKLSYDYLPSIDACLLTGITPQDVEEKGVDEVEFLQTLLREFTKPNTVTAGFNSIKFDDEFIRNALYKNLFDPYQREYINNCSRWDIINLVRACHDLSPDGVNFFHKTDKGNTSVKLVHLTEDNNIEQVGAHDALVDVKATINVANLIKTKQRALYSYYFDNHYKQKIRSLIDFINHTPLILTSDIFSSPHGFTRPILPLYKDGNRVYAFDLTYDANIINEVDEDKIYTCEGMISFQINKSPFLAPLKVLDKDDRYKRLNIDKSTIERNLEILLSDKSIFSKFALNKSEYKPEKKDPELLLYDDSLLTDRDKLNLKNLQAIKPSDKLYKNVIFDQTKYHELLFRQVCRNWPQFLTDEQKRMWKNFCASRLLHPLDTNLDYETYMRNINEKLQSKDVSGKDKLILEKLKEYGQRLFSFAFE